MCRHHQARQIHGTQFWAIMNIDSPAKRRFLARVLEFSGYREEVIEFACVFQRPESSGTPRPSALGCRLSW